MEKLNHERNKISIEVPMTVARSCCKIKISKGANCE